MALPQEKLLFTPEYYLEFERAASERHEFYEGYIYTMAGESLSHSRICINLAGEMRNLLRGTACEALSPNMKVRAIGKGMFAYPDLTVVCGQPIFHDEKRDVLLNPVVLFEVLSPSTQKFDRVAKFMRYRHELETFNDYILISQDIPLVQYYNRQPNGDWMFRDFFGVEQSFKINSINCELRLSEIYDRVEFNAEQMASLVETGNDSA